MYPLLLHPSLTTEKWSGYSLDQQLLMIGNEINRLINGIKAGQNESERRSTIERAFELTDLTISCQKGSLQKELLLWRDVLATLYLLNYDDFSASPLSQKLYKVLLLMNPKTALLL